MVGASNRVSIESVARTGTKQDHRRNPMRMFALLILGIFTATGAGCMDDVKSSKEAKTFTYDCSGLGQGWGDCAKKADAQCGAHNYATESQNGEADNKGTGGNTEMKRTLVVSCKH